MARDIWKSTLTPSTCFWPMVLWYNNSVRTRHSREEETLLRGSRFYCDIAGDFAKTPETGSRTQRQNICFVCPATVVLTGLEPNTTYEVRVAAVNGKGQGEFSHAETFQTLPIRESRRLHRAHRTCGGPVTTFTLVPPRWTKVLLVMWSCFFFCCYVDSNHISVHWNYTVEEKEGNKKYHCLLP